MNSRKLPFILGAIPLALGLVSTLFFLIQGGFGGGHGRFDLIVALNALPLGVFGFESVSFPKFIERHDILLVVWFPALINASAFFLFGLLVKAIVVRFSGKAESP